MVERGLDLGEEPGVRHLVKRVARVRELDVLLVLGAVDITS
jgi:hypothetical protein